MRLFEKHLSVIASVITVDKATEQLMVQDFAIIRKHLLDILAQNTTLNYILTEEKYFDGEFDNTFVFDFSRIFKLNVYFIGKNSPLLGFRKIGEVESKLTSATVKSGFFYPNHMLNGERITLYVRNQLKAGLVSSGCFVRGHRGDIYELELITNKKFNELITIKVIYEYGTLWVDFKVLIKVAQTLAPPRPEPHPAKSVKTQWLAAADMRTTMRDKAGFSLYAPLLVGAVTACKFFPLALRLCARLLHKWNLHLLNSFLLSAFYDEYLCNYERNQHSSISIADIVVAVFTRMEHYFSKYNFPYYWDTRINLLAYFIKRRVQDGSHKYIRDITKNIDTLMQDPALEFESVQEFFGIGIDSGVLIIDDFGLYTAF